jgi:hypothetical protein
VTAKRHTNLLLLCVALVAIFYGCSSVTVPASNNATIAVTDPTPWSHKARIAGHGLSQAKISAIIEKVQEAQVFIANYSGPVADKNSTQIAQEGTEVHFINGNKDDTILYSPVLGEVSIIESTHNKFGLGAALPSINRGGVVRLEKKEN